MRLVDCLRQNSIFEVLEFVGHVLTSPSSPQQVQNLHNGFPCKPTPITLSQSQSTCFCFFTQTLLSVARTNLQNKLVNVFLQQILPWFAYVSVKSVHSPHCYFGLFQLHVNFISLQQGCKLFSYCTFSPYTLHVAFESLLQTRLLEAYSIWWENSFSALSMTVTGFTSM